MSASAYLYEPRPDPNIELREMIYALVNRHKRYRVGMIYLKPARPDGWSIANESNACAKRRTYRRAGANEKRCPQLLGSLLRLSAANEVWCIDFVFDSISGKRVLKCLTIINDATYEAVAIEIEGAFQASA